jgi:hypothetical protein
MTQQNRDTFNRHTGKKQFHGKRIAEAMRMTVGHAGQDDKAP